jgi:predicted YcjX-like family ATPase
MKGKIMSDIYLTDEFKEFSTTMVALKEEKEKIEKEFKVVYTEFKQQTALIENKAAEVEETWNKFVEASKAE